MTSWNYYQSNFVLVFIYSPINMASDSDFSGDDFSGDNLSLANPASDQSMSDVSSFDSSGSWDPQDICDSDDYNLVSDAEDLEYASDDFIVSRDPEIRLPIVDPISEFHYVAVSRDVKPGVEIPFTNEPVGYSNNIPIFESPTEAFMSIIDEEVVESICIWTNERAKKYFEDKPNAILNGMK